MYRLAVRRTWPVTDDAVGVEFVVPAALADTFVFVPGQYLTLAGTIDGVSLRRSYSICSPAGGPLRIGVKRIEGGRFSNYIADQVHAGSLLDVLPPQGNFTLQPNPAHHGNYLMIAAGSGITPVYSLLTSVLAGEPGSRVTLIYGNRRTATMMFRDELCWLKNAHLEQFHWINVFTREEQDALILNGRIDNKKGVALNRHLIEVGGYDGYYLCGPEAMISAVSRGLRAGGVPESAIHYELFFASAEDARAVVAKHHARAARFGGNLSSVTVRAGGRATAFELAADAENILDAALATGVDLPFSCKGGVCATCKARLVSGEVEMDLNHALSAGEVDAGFVLTCQAHPLSPEVVLDYDAV
jgi:ring-1,2-phenylacetyl-CoA epoxidase subunit PaaE